MVLGAGVVSAWPRGERRQESPARISRTHRMGGVPCEITDSRCALYAKPGVGPGPGPMTRSGTTAGSAPTRMAARRRASLAAAGALT